MRRIGIMITALVVSLYFLGTSAALAQTCDVSDVKTSLKKSLKEFFSDPTNTPVNIQKIRDLLVFYISLPPGPTTDCGAVGAQSGTTIKKIIVETAPLPSIPTCSDGTEYGECSGSKPKYCLIGFVANKCGICGCPIGLVCQSNGACGTNVSIACGTNGDCGISKFSGITYCGANKTVMDNYTAYTCVNPGTPSSFCKTNTTAMVNKTCGLNQTCSGGSCLNGPNITCSTNSNCGTNKFLNSTFCVNNTVRDYFLSYSCNNPGTPSSFCSNDTTITSLINCGNKTCISGSCS